MSHQNQTLQTASRNLSLEQLTIDDAAPAELISIAGQLGCRYVSLFMRPARRPPEWFPWVIERATRTELAQRMNDVGITPYTVDFFPLSPWVRIDSYRPAFEAAAEFGAKKVSVLVSDADKSRRLARFCALCDCAADYGLGVNLEFVPITELPSLSEAVCLLTLAQRDNAGITVDVLHLMRSGGSVAELVTLDPRLIGAVQLSDGPAEMAAEQREFEALSQRMIPGTGAFPLIEFVRAVPTNVPLGVEVPLKSLRDSGMSALDRARSVVDATRHILEKAGSMRS